MYSASPLGQYLYALNENFLYPVLVPKARPWVRLSEISTHRSLGRSEVKDWVSPPGPQGAKKFGFGRSALPFNSALMERDAEYLRDLYAENPHLCTDAVVALLGLAAKSPWCLNGLLPMYQRVLNNGYKLTFTELWRAALHVPPYRVDDFSQLQWWFGTRPDRQVRPDEWHHLARLMADQPTMEDALAELHSCIRYAHTAAYPLALSIGYPDDLKELNRALHRAPDFPLLSSLQSMPGPWPRDFFDAPREPD